MMPGPDVDPQALYMRQLEAQISALEKQADRLSIAARYDEQRPLEMQARQLRATLERERQRIANTAVFVDANGVFLSGGAAPVRISEPVSGGAAGSIDSSNLRTPFSDIDPWPVTKLGETCKHGELLARACFECQRDRDIEVFRSTATGAGMRLGVDQARDILSLWSRASAATWRAVPETLTAEDVRQILRIADEQSGRERERERQAIVPRRTMEARVRFTREEIAASMFRGEDPKPLSFAAPPSDLVVKKVNAKAFKAEMAALVAQKEQQIREVVDRQVIASGQGQLKELIESSYGQLLIDVARQQAAAPPASGKAPIDWSDLQRAGEPFWRSTYPAADAKTLKPAPRREPAPTPVVAIGARRSYFDED
jgi:hypothetical protein